MRIGLGLVVRRNIFQFFCGAQIAEYQLDDYQHGGAELPTVLVVILLIVSWLRVRGPDLYCDVWYLNFSKMIIFVGMVYNYE